MEQTKENVKFCNRLVERFSGLRFAGTLSPVALQELATALLIGPTDQEQAAAIVQNWIEEHADYPTPADIYQMARASRSKLPPPCKDCSTSALPGYIRARMTIKEGVFAGETHDAMALCTCARGDALREAALKFKRESEAQAEPGLEKLTP